MINVYFVLFFCFQLREIAEDYNLTLPPSPQPESPSSIASQFGWLFTELYEMFSVAKRIQPNRFDSSVVVLLDEFGSVVGNALIKQAQQSPQTESPLISSHLDMVRRLCTFMKDERRTQLFFVTGIAQLNLSVRQLVVSTPNAASCVCDLRTNACLNTNH
jgi:hypothetical protein